MKLINKERLAHKMSYKFNIPFDIALSDINWVILELETKIDKTQGIDKVNQYIYTSIKNYFVSKWLNKKNEYSKRDTNPITLDFAQTKTITPEDWAILIDQIDLLTKKDETFKIAMDYVLKIKSKKELTKKLREHKIPYQNIWDCLNQYKSVFTVILGY